MTRVDNDFAVEADLNRIVETLGLDTIIAKGQSSRTLYLTLKNKFEVCLIGREQQWQTMSWLYNFKAYKDGALYRNSQFYQPISQDLVTGELRQLVDTQIACNLMLRLSRLGVEEEKPINKVISLPENWGEWV